MDKIQRWRAVLLRYSFYYSLHKAVELGSWLLFYGNRDSLDSWIGTTKNKTRPKQKEKSVATKQRQAFARSVPVHCLRENRCLCWFCNFYSSAQEGAFGRKLWRVLLGGSLIFKLLCPCELCTEVSQGPLFFSCAGGSIQQAAPQDGVVEDNQANKLTPRVAG